MLFVTSIAFSWSPFLCASLLYWYYKNMVLRFVRYRLVFNNLIWKFISINPAWTHRDEQQHHFLRDRHCNGWVYSIDTREIRFLGLYDNVWFFPSHFKVYTHLLCINTQWQTTAPFYLWLPLSRVSLLYWYYKNMVLMFVWYGLVLIHLILNFIPIYPALKHSDEQ